MDALSYNLVIETVWLKRVKLKDPLQFQCSSGLSGFLQIRVLPELSDNIVDEVALMMVWEIKVLRHGFFSFVSDVCKVFSKSDSELSFCFSHILFFAFSASE